MTGKKISTKSKLISVLSVLCVALAVLSVITTARLKAMERTSEINSLKCLGEFCESLEGISTTLKKSLYAGTADMLRENGNDLYRQASVAKVSLASLTDESTESDEIYKFLSQVGDYTLYLSKRDPENFSLSDEDMENLKNLCDYSEKLSVAFEEISISYNNGGVTFSQSISTISDESDYEKISFSQSFTDSQQTMSDYPTLLYDGPFADTVINQQANYLPENEVTAEEAQKKAAELLGESPATLKQETDVSSQIEMFCFSKGDAGIGITKKGGFVCYLINSVYAGEATISTDEAVKRGIDYLKKVGYTKPMKESYYSVYDGICTVNYAYCQDDVICYSDLIKVSISLESGKIVSLDARGYLMNHRERLFSENILSAEECKTKLSPVLNVIKTQKALIPLDTGKEALCYEFHCKDSEGSEVLVYIDCQTGKEQDIMLLLYSDNGVLAK